MTAVAPSRSHPRSRPRASAGTDPLWIRVLALTAIIWEG